MNLDYIYDPITKQKYNLNTLEGKKVLKKLINFVKQNHTVNDAEEQNLRDLIFIANDNETIELPNELSFGQILVKVEYSGICGSQIGEIEGVKGPDNYLPHLLGHEGCATVLETGPGVSNIKKDDLVVLHWMEGRGIQSQPPIYKWEGKNLTAGWVTTFNSHAVVSENRCTVIPANTNKELAALFGCAITTGFGVIENNVNLQFGQSLVVFGSGGIGLNIIQAASLRNAFPIIAVDIFDNRLELASDMGADFLINAKKVNAKEEILKILNNRELDVFIDNTGNPKIIELGYEVTKPTGKVALVGVPMKDQNINIFSLPLHFGKTIFGSHGGESNPNEDIARYLNLIQAKNLQIDKLITGRFKLEEINKAIEFIKSGQSAGRIMIYT